MVSADAFQHPAIGGISVGDIFVSYAREDLWFVSPLVSALQAQGWTVWWDRLMPVGDVADLTIERALNDARCIVVVWSKNSVNSIWVRNEAAEGRDRQILIPVILDDTIPPFGFRLINGVNFTNWSDPANKKSFKQLRNSIESLIGHRATARPAQGSGEVTPSQVIVALCFLILFISVVVSTSLDKVDQGDGRGNSPQEPLIPTKEVDPPITSSAPAPQDLSGPASQPTPGNSDTSSVESAEQDISDFSVPETYALPPAPDPDESARIGTGQIVVIARPSTLAWKDLVFMIDDHAYGYDGIVDRHAIEVLKISVSVGQHFLRVNPELNEEPISFNVLADEEIEIEFYRSSYSRWDWKVYINGNRVR